MNAFDVLQSKNARLTAALPDGRLLGYSDTGDQSLPPVFYFHGFPGSRLEASFLPLKSARLIGVDRPGYGLSSPKRGRKLADFPKDVAALADHLQIKKFSIMGVSGGGPYAAACAHWLPERVAAAALVCPLGPPEAPGMSQGRLRMLTNLARRPITRNALFGIGRAIVLDDNMMRRAAAYRARQPRAEADRGLMTSDMGRLMLTSWREAIGKGVAGMSSDSRIYGTPWGWRISEMRVPTYLWHGHADTVVPSSIGRYYAARVPDMHATFTDNDGHFSIVLNHADDIIQRLISHL